MAVIYVFLGLSVLLMNATKIPDAFAVIFKNAFGWKAAAGGAAGWVFKQVTDSMRQGIARGIFSNEAGLGSAAIAASSAQVDEPVAQGLVSMTGTFIDTIIICTMTGLAIVIAFYTGEAAPMGVGELKGVAITSTAFSRVLGGDGQSVQFLLMICLIFFAFTTILGWDYYSERCIEYLTNGKMKIVKFYRALYIIAIAIGRTVHDNKRGMDYRGYHERTYGNSKLYFTYSIKRSCSKDYKRILQQVSYSGI